MKHRKFLLAVMLALSASSLVNAKNIFLSQAGSGSSSGVDNANAHPMTWFNDSGNWGSGNSQINPGDVVHLVGAFTSPLIVQGNGVPGSPITIFFDPGANFTTACWPSTGAIQLNNVAWIVIDGGAGGIIRNTSNGTGLATQNNSRGIGGSGNGTGILQHGVIQNLIITNVYTKTKGNLDPTRAGYGIDLSGSSITISNCTVSDGDGGLSYSATATSQSDILMLKNTVLNCNHSICVGMGDHNCYLTNLVIANNLLDHWDVWDCPGNTPIHLDGIMLFNDAYDRSSVLDGIRICGNTFGGFVGTRTTAAIFTDLGCAVQNYFIYNNLFLCYPPGNWGNGFITAGGSNVWVVNNTLAGTVANGQCYGGGVFVSGVNGYVLNNVVVGGSLGLSGSTSNAAVNSSQQGANSFAVVSTYLTSLWSDRNVFSNPNLAFQLGLGNMNNGNYLWLSGIIGPNLKDWQTWYENEWGTGQLGNTPLVPGLAVYAATHCDPNSVNTLQPFLTSSYAPMSSDTLTRGKGTNLYWLGITNDLIGNPRLPTGNWTIGAFEVAGSGSTGTGTNTGGGGTNSGPNAPAVSIVASSSSLTYGASFTLAWSSLNATNLIITGLSKSGVQSTIPVSGLSGSTDILGNVTTTYSVTAAGPGGTASANTSVTVRPAPPSKPWILPDH